MDKLEPVIRQKFWILLVLCLGLAMFGFFKGQSAVVAATEAREKVLKEKLSGISKGQSPNEDYQKSLEFINQEYDKQIGAAVKELFDLQQSRMVWPEKVASEIPKEHRSADPIATATRIKYQKDYDRIITELWKKVEPVVPKTVPGTIGGRLAVAGNPADAHLREPVTWTQKVYCDRDAIPQKFLPQLPESDALWDAQEDVWFVELLFEAIRNVNRNADSPLNAVVRKINLLELKGGSGDTSMAAAESAAGSDGEGMSGLSSMRESYASRAAQGGDMEGFGGGGGAYTAKVDFDPAEEFGSDAAAAEESTESTEAASATSFASSSGAYGAAGVPGLRWYALKEDAPYRERGFYLSVVMQQSRIPDFMVELTGSKWPIRVVRFQMGPNPDFKDPTGGMGYGAGDLAEAGSGGFGRGGGHAGSRNSSAMAAASGGGTLGLGAATMSSRSGMMSMMMGGGARGGRTRQPGAGLAFIGTATDPFAGTLNSPELVQVDIAGIITFYMRTKDDGTSAVETPAVDTPAAPATEAAPPTEGTPTDPAAPPSAEAPTDGTTPAPVTTPVEGAEQTPAAEGTTPATEQPAETPPATEIPPADPASTDAPPDAAPATPPPATGDAPPANETPTPPN
jgi:hypothetical protein